jgi:hypothetical protein
MYEEVSENLVTNTLMTELYSDVGVYMALG